MPRGKSPGPSIKKKDTYEAVKAEGKSKEFAAKIANSQVKKKSKSK